MLLNILNKMIYQRKLVKEGETDPRTYVPLVVGRGARLVRKVISFWVWIRHIWWRVLRRRWHWRRWIVIVNRSRWLQSRPRRNGRAQRDGPDQDRIGLGNAAMPVAEESILSANRRPTCKCSEFASEFAERSNTLTSLLIKRTREKVLAIKFLVI